MWFSVVLLLVVLVLVLRKDYLRKRSNRWKLLSQFPGYYPLPVIGNALQVGLSTDGFSNRLLKIWRKFDKKSFRVTMGNEDWVFLCQPEDIEVMLNNTAEVSKPIERNSIMLLFFRNSVTTSEGERWRTVRKLVTSCFTTKYDEHHVATLNKNSKRLVSILDEHTQQGNVDMYLYLRALMFDSMCSSVMGVEYNMIEDLEHPFLITGKNVIRMLTSNFFAYWRTVKAIFVLTPIYKKMMTAVYNIRHTSDIIMNERRKMMEDQNNNTNDNFNTKSSKQNEKSLQDYDLYLLDKFFNSKLSNGDNVPDLVINEEISTVLFIAHYTTSLTMSHVMYQLAKHPEIQQRVIQEQLSIFETDKLRPPALEDLGRMKYLDAVIKETLRIIPPLTTTGRRLQNDLHLKDGKIVPAGAATFILYQTLFHNEDIFPEPFKFIPERFFAPVRAYTFIPYSAGPRNCIGARYAGIVMKTVLSIILRRFEVFEGGPGTEPEFAHRIVTESINGIQLKLKSRVLQ